ncbi:multicopper oxidase domain-containing protein [Mesorhizobium sp. M0578]|uniref:multicopper oxidase domain-containing protein n=1 Tax=unclassified Mesorhizobium TaxID=325217 RepID=UPI00333D3A41
MSFGAGGPPPTLRLLRDRPFSIDVVNDLDEATSVHWHGLRIANPWTACLISPSVLSRRAKASVTL